MYDKVNPCQYYNNRNHKKKFQLNLAQLTQVWRRKVLQIVELLWSMNGGTGRKMGDNIERERESSANKTIFLQLCDIRRSRRRFRNSWSRWRTTTTTTTSATLLYGISHVWSCEFNYNTICKFLQLYHSSPDPWTFCILEILEMVI